MATTGPISHIDISAGYPDRSIAFYEALLTALGFRRSASDLPGFAGERPQRAGWGVKMAGGAWFGIEVRPAREDARDRRYDRYAPGPHHIAFHAESPATVDAVHAAMLAAGAEVLDPPTDYSGQAGYGAGYYAAFYADPDGLKLEVVYEPRSNP
jgi:catechol 2,3-dioxygenase-like lactoylglutathione lyase family enzyme